MPTEIEIYHQTDELIVWPPVTPHIPSNPSSAFKMSKKSQFWPYHSFSLNLSLAPYYIEKNGFRFSFGLHNLDPPACLGSLLLHSFLKTFVSGKIDLLLFHTLFSFFFPGSSFFILAQKANNVLRLKSSIISIMSFLKQWLAILCTWHVPICAPYETVTL